MWRECLHLLSFAKLQSTTFPASGRPAWKSSNSACGTSGHAPTPGISCALGSKLPPHRLKFYRFWDNVTWLELDPFISGPRTVNLCKFWLDLAFECKRPDWKKNIRRVDSPPLPEYLRPFVEATTSGPASGTWVWSSCQWHCFMSPVVINGTSNSDGFRSFYLSW